MLDKSLPLLLSTLVIFACNDTNSRYTFVLCQSNGSEIIGYNSTDKTGGGYDYYGFPVVSCASTDLGCMTFPFYFAMPNSAKGKEKVYSNGNFLINFEFGEKITLVHFVNRKTGIKSTSTYDKNDGLVKYNIYQNGDMYEYQKCKGRFDAKDLPQTV